MRDEGAASDRNAHSLAYCFLLELRSRCRHFRFIAAAEISGSFGASLLSYNSDIFVHPLYVMQIIGRILTIPASPRAWAECWAARRPQGWRDSSHTAIVGAGKCGSAKLPM